MTAAVKGEDVMQGVLNGAADGFMNGANAGHPFYAGGERQKKNGKEGMEKSRSRRDGRKEGMRRDLVNRYRQDFRNGRVRSGGTPRAGCESLCKS